MLLLINEAVIGFDLGFMHLLGLRFGMKCLGTKLGLMGLLRL